MTKKEPPTPKGLAGMSAEQRGRVQLPDLPEDADAHGGRLVSTEEGLAVLLAGGSMADALAADDEHDRRWAERLADEEQARKDRAERRRLDIAERRLRVDRALRRRQREGGGTS